MPPPKTIEQCKKAISQAVSRAYDVRITPDELSTEHITRDVRAFISKHAGKPHHDLKVADVAALALSRAERKSGDEALGSTIADLIDGGISMERPALVPRGLDAIMSRHRDARARTNPLPADTKVKARAAAPRVIRRSSGGSAIARDRPKPREVTVSVGSRVRYRRLDDGTDHEIILATPKPGDGGGPRRVPPGSPLGLALRGTSRGAIVSFNLAGTPVEIEILSVEPGLS